MATRSVAEQRRALERLLVDGDRAPQRADRARLVRHLRLQVLGRDLLREQRAEANELRDRRLRVLHRDAQLQHRIAVAVAGVLIAHGLGVAAERAGDLRRLVRLGREILALHADLERGDGMHEPVLRDRERPADRGLRRPRARPSRWRRRCSGRGCTTGTTSTCVTAQVRVGGRRRWRGRARADELLLRLHETARGFCRSEPRGRHLVLRARADEAVHERGADREHDRGRHDDEHELPLPRPRRASGRRAFEHALPQALRRDGGTCPQLGDEGLVPVHFAPVSCGHRTSPPRVASKPG